MPDYEVTMAVGVLTEGYEVGRVQLPGAIEMDGEDVVNFQMIEATTEAAPVLAAEVLAAQCRPTGGALNHRAKPEDRGDQGREIVRRHVV
jgi:hypothetical protein